MLKKEVILEGLVKGRDKMEEHNNVINKIQKKLSGVQQIEKCKKCECFLNVLEAVQGDLTEIGADKGEPIFKDIEQWLDAGYQGKHSCLDCKICSPLKPYEEFNKEVRSERERNGKAPLKVRLAPKPCACGGTCLTKPKACCDEE